MYIFCCFFYYFVQIWSNWRKKAPVLWTFMLNIVPKIPIADNTLSFSAFFKPTCMASQFVLITNIMCYLKQLCKNQIRLDIWHFLGLNVQKCTYFIRFLFIFILLKKLFEKFTELYFVFNFSLQKKPNHRIVLSSSSRQ